MAVDYTVEVPTVNGTWQEDERFDTEKEAIAYVQKHYGADEKGRVYLVYGPHGEPDDDDEMLDDEDIYSEDEK